MKQVVLSYNKRNLNAPVRIKSESSSSSSSGFYFEYIAYQPPSTNNGTFANQCVMKARLLPSSGYNYFSLNEIGYYVTIQHKTITSNGTYTPYDDNTVIKKIVVNVPTQTINNYNYGTITENGWYLIPSGYTGISNFTVSVTIPNIYMDRMHISYGVNSTDVYKDSFYNLYSNNYYTIPAKGILVEISVANDNITTIRFYCNFNSSSASINIGSQLGPKRKGYLIDLGTRPGLIWFYGSQPTSYITGTSFIRDSGFFDFTIKVMYDILN